tara:strand:+ start:116 stop:451 length:336 start_codon:yes stop_codon:yes gene_type:complete
MKPDSIPVKVSVLKIILGSMKPMLYRSESLLKDALNESMLLSPIEMTALSDVYASAISLQQLLEDCIEEAAEHDIDVIKIPKIEFRLITDLAKVVESANRIVIRTTPLWEH